MTKRTGLPRRLSIALGLAGCFAQSAWATAAPAVEPRIVAQEGLAIALASIVLQSQVNILEDTLTAAKCHALGGGGSVQTLSRKKVSATQTQSQVALYFDTACKTSYIEASSTATRIKGGYTVTGTDTFFGLAGQTLGSLAIDETATDGKSDLVLQGLGTFTPANGAQAVHLGLACTLPTSATATSFKCEGGIAQTFPAVNLSLASVTPLTLTVHGKAPKLSVTFAGKTSMMRTGAAGSLSITTPSAKSLGIGGGGTAFGSAATAGHAARFALFPPTPTGWTVTDAAHGARFALQVASNTARNAQAQVTDIASGSALATIAVDQSGTGLVSYADGTTDAVTSWLLAD